MTGNSKLTFHKNTAIVLFQLGGPDSLEAVQPFLYDLFMDPDIIDFPLASLARQPLARFISNRRSIRVQEKYKLIGGRSPILSLTERQAKALEVHLSEQDIDARVFIAMRYWHPMTEEVIQEISKGGFEHIILLPLYPQFSKATTYSSMNEWKRQAKKYSLDIPMSFICCYPNHPALLEAFVENINETLSRFNSTAPENVDLVFSAHGVPTSYIRKGDPYKLHVEETVRGIVELGKWKSPHTLCYQSKAGPFEWLKPSLIETVERLTHEGHKNLLIIPVSFVTDHIETLHEINIEVRNHAMMHGVRQFELMQALNDHPKFIKCLSELIQSQLSTDIQPKMCNVLWDKNKDQPIPKMCPWKNT
jgi:ferrochelatase